MCKQVLAKALNSPAAHSAKQKKITMTVNLASLIGNGDMLIGFWHIIHKNEFRTKQNNQLVALVGCTYLYISAKGLARKLCLLFMTPSLLYRRFDPPPANDYTASTL